MFELCEEVRIVSAKNNQGFIGKVLDRKTIQASGTVYLVRGGWYLESQLEGVRN